MKEETVKLIIAFLASMGLYMISRFLGFQDTVLLGIAVIIGWTTDFD